MSMKNPLILAGIEPATFRFVAQHLNHCATAVSPYFVVAVGSNYPFPAWVDSKVSGGDEQRRKT